jgi:competence protein ComEA
MQVKPTLSKSSLRGTLIFVLLLVLLFVLPDLWCYFNPGQPAHISFSDPETQAAVHRVQRNSARSRKRDFRRSRYSAPPARFDPNTYTVEEWMGLGLSEKQASVILKFTKYGIYSNDDLKKIFVISDELYGLIKDSTHYPERPAYGSRYEKEAVADLPAGQAGKAGPKAVRQVAINTATAEELLDVRGIGPFFAKQILKRRDELGGFYDQTQLMEVWKMDEEKLAQLVPFLIFDADGLRKIHLNTATAEDLKAHPYISWNLANSIVKLRSQNGPYRRVEDVKKSALMTDELYEKLKRYLTVDP